MSEQESGGGGGEEITNPDMTSHDVEKMEEAKLKAKYPTAVGGLPGRPGPGGHSAFLQKRLAKGQKYFDSGDYQMAKQKMSGGVSKQPLKVPVPSFGTGDAIPTPDSVPARKTSIIQSSKLTHNAS